MSDFLSTRRDLIAGVTAAALVARPAFAAGKAARRDGAGAKAADSVCRALKAQIAAPALTAAVAGPDRLLWSAAYGIASVELGVPVTTDHRFRLGSVCKPLTATLAAKLVSRGTIDLDAPIATWLPDLPAPHQRTTLRQLLTHRGGVRHYIPRDLDVREPGGPIYLRVYPTSQSILDVFIHDPLVAEPGTKSSYSSFGYTLASLVMEKAAQRPFVEMIKSEIGKAMGFDSLIEDDPWRLVPRRVSGYLNERDLVTLYGQLPAEARPALTGGLANIPQSNPAYCWAGAGFLMSTPDAARFGAAMLDSPRARISAAERELLFTPQTERANNIPPLGLAWQIDHDPKGRPRWHHEGSTPGGRFALILYPEHGLAIALASNVMSAPADVQTPVTALAEAFI
jgi:CubicO group peptidase (beta-lactamase class C family)